LGALFRKRTRTLNKVEMLVFITPKMMGWPASRLDGERSLLGPVPRGVVCADASRSTGAWRSRSWSGPWRRATKI